MSHQPETNRRKLWTFHGGVHPPFHKDDSNQQAIKAAGIPPQLFFPLRQHIGQDAEPVVKAGDKVFKGQIIAEANQNGLSANIHAPTSGTINGIQEHPLPHASGLSGLCIILDTDGKDDWGKYQLEPFPNFEKTNLQKLLDRVQQAGIVGLGGAAFPTAVKLAGSSNKQIDTFIINAAECEPYITCDDLLMREKAVEIITGIKVIQQMVNPKECLIGIEDNKPEAIKIMQKACETESDIEVVAIPTIYPSGGEKQLIKILTGKEVPAGGLPMDIGILGQNVGTVYSIYQAVVEGIPLISRAVTVTGNGVQQPQNFNVLNGTPIRYLAEQAGGYTKMADHLIMGGPMMGFALQDDNIPVVKATNCTLFISTTVLNESNSAFSKQPTLPCIRCGKCMDACPVNLLPQQMYWHIRAKDFERAQSHNLKDCIECGSCSFVCPSHIPLVDYYRFAKSEIRDQEQAQRKADRARQRHEFLEFRKKRDKREREEKRAAHKAALQKKKDAAAKAKAESGEENPADVKAEAIKAAMERTKAKKEARANEEKTSK
jgi:electron transport complex protein RnfC